MKGRPKNSELTTIPEDYAVRLQLARLKEVEENAERLALDNKKKRYELDKTAANLAYLDVAEASINAALGPIANLIRNFDQMLANRLHLTGEQTAIVQDAIDDLLSQLAALNISIESTLETDARNSHEDSATRDKRQRDAKATRANRK